MGSADRFNGLCRLVRTVPFRLTLGEQARPTKLERSGSWHFGTSIASVLGPTAHERSLDDRLHDQAISLAALRATLAA